jgi:hypothetical protein
MTYTNIVFGQTLHKNPRTGFLKYAHKSQGGMHLAQDAHLLNLIVKFVGFFSSQIKLN